MFEQDCFVHTQAFERGSVQDTDRHHCYNLILRHPDFDTLVWPGVMV